MNELIDGEVAESDFQLTAEVFTDVEIFPMPETAQDAPEVLPVEEPPLRPSDDAFSFEPPTLVPEEPVPTITAFEQRVIDLVTAQDFNPFNGSYYNADGFGIDQDLFWAVSMLHNDLDAAGVLPADYGVVAHEWFSV